MVVTFFRGHPSNDLLPRAEILKAVTEVLSNPEATDEDEETRHPLTYGSDPGALEVRKTISEWINASQPDCKAPATADCINMTNGASFGAASALLQCCPSSYTRRAYAISPTYFLINQILTDAGFGGRTTAIIETESGVDLHGLELSLIESNKLYPEDQAESKQPLKFRYVLYIVPVFSNPGGYTTSEEENRALLNLARKYDVLLLCDHVYDHLNYGVPDTKFKTLVSLDRESLPANSKGNVIANCSFSKYLGPGLRVGWQECATPELAHHLSQSGANKSGGSPSHFNTFITRELLLNGGIDRILHNLNTTYGSRAQAYREAMETYLPQGTKIQGGKGGYFFWIEFPAGYDVQAITSDCASHGIKLAPGQHFEVLGDEKGWGKKCFRVSLSYHTIDEAVAAIKIWGEISEQHFETPAASN